MYIYIYIWSWEDKKGKFTIGDDGEKYRLSRTEERKQGSVFYFVPFVTVLIVISYRTIVTDSKLQLKWYFIRGTVPLDNKLRALPD